jgi:hypothetical protein
MWPAVCRYSCVVAVFPVEVTLSPPRSERKSMKRFSRVAAIALVLAAATVAPAAASGGISGTYTTTVTSGSLKGTYKILFTPGHFEVKAPYGITGKGTDTISGSRITLHGPSKECTTPGLYEFKISGSSLTFKKIKDSCPRVTVMVGHTFKKI